MHFLSTFSLLCSTWALTSTAQSPPTDRCTASGIPAPEVFGAQITSIVASITTDYSFALPQTDSHFALNVTGLDFCNITIQYTHPGQNDLINVFLWLPLNTWNGRFMGTGGGGLAAEIAIFALPYAVSLGYAAVATDGGHASEVLDASSWALSSPGNVNWVLLQDFAAVALDDATTIGKAITTSYYGSAPEYSYWNGCSTGGRQGMMMAQRYPSQYDGILAAAPAINWDRFVVAEYWAQLVMNQMSVYPSQCEFQAITAAAIAACDDLDGVTDGIIAAPGLCDFDPRTVAGQTYNCTSNPGINTISSEAAEIALAAWTGPRSVDDEFQWYGLNRDASLSLLVNTSCSTNTSCTGQPSPIIVSWINLFVQEDPEFDLTNITYREFDTIFRQSRNRYASILGTSDADLTDFRDAGGKMISWHGLADESIATNGTYEYYDRVLALDPEAADYFRFFPAPGLGHCSGGVGYFPGDSLQSLVDWVENDIVPEILNGTTLPDASGVVREAPLCAYPLVAAYRGGDINVASSFVCEDSF